MIGILSAIILIGGIIYFVNKSNTASNTATSTAPVVDSNPIPSNPATPTQSGQPRVVTGSIASVSDTTAVVNGTVNPNGALTSYWYEYGKTSNLGSKTPNSIVGSGWVTTQASDYIVNLSKDTSYYFRLVAENKNGRVAGDVFTFKTSVGTPAPLGSSPSAKTLSANNVARTSANINGEVTPNRASTQYWFEYGKTDELGNTSAVSNVGDGTAKVGVATSLTNLEPLTKYYFRINAQNQFGTVNGVIMSFNTTGPAAASSPKVNTSNAANVATTTVSLRGTVNPSGADTSYWFEYSTDSLLGSVLIKSTPRITLAAGNENVTVREDVTGLNSKTTYYFRLVAQNYQGMVRGDTMSFKTR